jgi:predicted transcriptional regulator
MGIVALVVIFLINQLMSYFSTSKLEKFVKEDVPIEVSEKKVIQVAMKNGGKTTIPEVCMKTNLSVDKAKETLTSLLEKNVLTIQMTENGSTIYSIIDMVSDQEKNEAIDLV